MFEIIVVIILVVWLINVSSRISSVEAKLKAGVMTPPYQPQDITASAKTSGVAWSQAHQTAALPSVDLSTHPTFKPESEAKNSGEVEIASNWLTKIGVVALLFGMAFFLKYAIDEGWISVWGRIIVGVVVGILFMVLGNLWRAKYARYASALTGGGIALLYFTVFAAFQFYHLIPQPVAFVLLAAITVTGIVLAFRYKSSPLGVLGISGAYLSPILLYSGSNQQVELFVYLGILALATVFLLFKFYWLEMAMLSFIGLVVDYSLWFMRFNLPENTITSFVFLALVVIVFTAGIALAFRKSHTAQAITKESAQGTALMSLVINGFYLVAIWFLLSTHFHSYLPLAAILGGVVAFLAYVIVDRLEYENLNFALAASGAVLIFFAAIWQYHGNTFDFLVMSMGLLALGLGTLFNRTELRQIGVIELVVAAILVLFTRYDYETYVFLVNAKFGLVVAETAALLVGSWLYSLIVPHQRENNAKEVLQVIAWVLLGYGVSVEILTYFRGYEMQNTRNLSLSVWWILYATFLIILGSVTHNAAVRKTAIVLFGISILKVFLWDVQSLDTGYRIVSFILLGVILLSVSFAYQRNKEKIAAFLEGEKEGIKS